MLLKILLRLILMAAAMVAMAALVVILTEMLRAVTAE